MARGPLVVGHRPLRRTTTSTYTSQRHTALGVRESEMRTIRAAEQITRSSLSASGWISTRTQVTAGDPLRGENSVPAVVPAEKGMDHTRRGLEDVHETPFRDHAVVRRVKHGHGMFR